MGGKTAIALGLVTGLVAGGLIVGAVIALTPPPSAPSVVVTPVPSPSVPSPAASPSPSTTAGPSAAPSVVPGDSPAPSGVPDPSTSVSEAVVIGEPPPPLVLPLIGGEDAGTVDLADYRGNPVWVAFIGTACTACQDALPLMSDSYARYGEENGLVVLAVDVGEADATVQAFVDDQQVGFPVALDESGEVQAAWGATVIPTHVWIDRDGVVRDTARAAIGPEDVARGLNAILDVEVTP